MASLAPFGAQRSFSRVRSALRPVRVYLSARYRRLLNVAEAFTRPRADPRRSSAHDLVATSVLQARRLSGAIPVIVGRLRCKSHAGVRLVAAFPPMTVAFLRPAQARLQRRGD